MFQTKTTPGYGTEYTDNFGWSGEHTQAGEWTRDTTTMFAHPAAPSGHEQYAPEMGKAQGTVTQRPQTVPVFTEDQSPYLPPTRVSRQEFYSEKYPSIFRETVIHKDDRGKYIDPFKNIATKPYGRRLMYDDTHPDKMYASQWSSELADENGCYSFPTTTGLAAEQPWTKDMAWRVESQEGHWPTDQWKQWAHMAECPPYDGHSDQPQYSLYKVNCPETYP